VFLSGEILLSVFCACFQVVKINGYPDRPPNPNPNPGTAREF
jgi:hypothetical protein